MAEKVFSCTGCGAPIKVYPPDDIHPDAARNKKDLMQEDIIEIPYKCTKCKIVNVILGVFIKFLRGLLSKLFSQSYSPSGIEPRCTYEHTQILSIKIRQKLHLLPTLKDDNF